MNSIYMTKRIGSTTYRVKIYAPSTGNENMEEKILRIIQNNGLANGKECGIIEMSQMSRSA